VKLSKIIIISTKHQLQKSLLFDGLRLSLNRLRKVYKPDLDYLMMIFAEDQIIAEKHLK